MSVRRLSSKDMLNASPTGILGNANTREKTMKSILLASASVVAFAGAASAAGHSTISWAGEATATYNTDAGALATTTELTASASAMLNNGITATASVTLDDTGVATGDITLATDSASITFGTGLGEAAYLADAITGQTEVAGVHTDAEAAEIAGSVTMSGFTLGASMNGDGTNLQVGVSTAMSGFDVAVGYVNDTNAWGVNVSGAAAGLDVTANFASGSSWGVSAGTTVGGIDLTASTGDTNAWEVGATYAMAPFTLGFTYANGGAYTISADYAAGALEVLTSYDGTDFDVEGSYDLGGGLVAYAGAFANASTYYVGVEYDLGSGASVRGSFNNTGAALDGTDSGAADYGTGTEVAVTFTF